MFKEGALSRAVLLPEKIKSRGTLSCVHSSQEPEPVKANKHLHTYLDSAITFASLLMGISYLSAP